MKKLFLLTAIAGMFALTNVSAQTKSAVTGGSKLGIGLDFAAPMGTLSDAYKVGFGASLQFQTPIVDRLNFTVSAGYLNFVAKDIEIDYWNKLPNYGAIPVKIGARYFITPKFYAGGELGATFSAGNGYSGTSFAYTPGIGFEIPVTNKGSLDLGARYESWSKDGTVRFFGLRAAYNFGL